MTVPAIAQTTKKPNSLSRIENLAPPKAAKPPRAPRETNETFNEDQETERQLQKKRQIRQKQRSRRNSNGLESKAPRELERTKDAYIPRDRAFCLELALVGGTTLTTGVRNGYTYEPNVHINSFYRINSSRFSGNITPWVGFRLAPFTGTGYHETKPGRYGLTYFGPILGLGQVEPVAEDMGPSNRTNISEEDDSTLPIVSGFAVTFGVAGVTAQGQRASEVTDSDTDDDFQTKNMAFDAPGAWVELRYFRIYQGATSADFVLGAQSGAEKVFIYGGVGFGGWY